LLMGVMAVASAACGGGTPTSPTNLATSLPAVTTTNSYSGTLALGASATHTFSTAGSGTLSISITALAPTNTVLMALGIGTWDGTSCAIQLSTNQAKLAETYQATINAAGNYCFSIADAGNLVESTTYTVQVIHP
jgi:hypothetical protein